VALASHKGQQRLHLPQEEPPRLGPRIDALQLAGGGQKPLGDQAPRRLVARHPGVEQSPYEVLVAVVPSRFEGPQHAARQLAILFPQSQRALARRLTARFRFEGREAAAEKRGITPALARCRR
jgi:hypothetical protein